MNFIVFWQKCSYVIWFYWNSFDFGILDSFDSFGIILNSFEHIPQEISSKTKVNHSQNIQKTTWLVYNVWILSCSFHRICDFRKEFDRFYRWFATNNYKKICKLLYKYFKDTYNKREYDPSFKIKRID